MHEQGRRTARENIADLVDEGSFVEYGALTVAAQRSTRPLQDLIERTPGDGVVLGTATVGGVPAAVMSYDYTVLAGTQGRLNHAKTDRFLRLAERSRLPVIVFGEGGGGRGVDTDGPATAGSTARRSGTCPGSPAGAADRRGVGVLLRGERGDDRCLRRHHRD